MFKQKAKLYSLLQSLKNLEDLRLLKIGQNHCLGMPRGICEFSLHTKNKE